MFDRNSSLVLAVCILALVLAACVPAPTPTPLPTSTPPPIPTLLPASTPMPTATAVAGGMPMLTEFSWDSAQELILSGEVTRIMQAHSREVLLALRDGRTVRTVEPELDDVFQVVRRRGERCAGIQLATE